MTQAATITSYNRDAFSSITPTVADQWELIAKAPMLNTLPMGMCSAKFHQWTEDVAYSFSTALSATASATATTFNVTAGTGANFMPGSILLVNSEVVKVTSISTDALTVVRGQQGTSGAIQSATGTTVYLIGNAQLEGATTPTGTYTIKTTRHNYCQIFQTPCKLTGSDMAISGPGGPQWEYTKRRTRMAHDALLDRSIKYNANVATGAASTLSYMKGMLGWYSATTYAITSSTIGGTSTSTAITKAKIDTFLRVLSTNGGSQWVAYCGMTAFQAVQDAMTAIGTKPTILASTEAQMAGFVFYQYVCAFGIVTFVLDRNARTGDAFFVEVSDDVNTGMVMRFLRPTFFEDLAKTGDYSSGVWITEMTLESHLPACGGLITSIASGS